jgi:hypothetical protein
MSFFVHHPVSIAISIAPTSTFRKFDDSLLLNRKIQSVNISSETVSHTEYICDITGALLRHVASPLMPAGGCRPLARQPLKLASDPTDDLECGGRGRSPSTPPLQSPRKQRTPSGRGRQLCPALTEGELQGVLICSAFALNNAPAGLHNHSLGHRPRCSTHLRGMDGAVSSAAPSRGQRRAMGV